MEKRMAKVTVLKAFPLGGAIVAPGEREVPEEMVERLVRSKIIEAPASLGEMAGSGAITNAERIENALTKLSSEITIKRNEGEGAADYIERLAESSKGQAGSQKARTK